MQKVLTTVFIFIACGVIALRAQDNPAPDPSRIVQSDRGLQLSLYFENVQQGRVGLIRLQSPTPLVNAEASVFDERIPFFEVFGQDGLFALIAVDLSQPLRTVDLAVVATTDTTTETLTTQFAITSGGFIRQDVFLVENTEELLDPAIEDSELTQIFSLAAPHTEGRLWDERGFSAPLAGELTSPFGAVRVFNGLYETLHTGWDYRATTGQPMRASASGVVAFAGRLPIRGNYVLINHGVGVYSGYAHLSVTHVTQGQPIKAEQIIGQVGSTGRSSSAHAHVEFIVNDRWIDSADFIRMYLP